MAKKSDGCSTLIGLGFILMIFSGAIKACSGPKSSPAAAVPSYLPASPPAGSPPFQALPALPVDDASDQGPGSYVPKTVVVRQAVEASIPGQRDTRTVPAGTELKVEGVYGYKVMVNIGGQLGSIPAAATDLLDQMVKAAGG